MTTPAQEVPRGDWPPMTPERWRAVDAVLRAVLAGDPSQREAIVADACAGDDALRHEVASLLQAHDRGSGDDFLERPAAEEHGKLTAPTPLAERLTRALADRYAIDRELAHGGMATVYLARDLRHDRAVAIKVMREELAAAVGAERFLEEIRVTASLQHPHILPLFDSGSSDGLLWYVMPFVDGETLRSRLSREGALPVDVALQLAREIADALEHAHQHGVVHRDVKPENVLLQGGHALVADFGISLALEHAGGDRLTQTGLTIGTPQYMAPEQAAGDRAIDARADVYALGVVLHEMLAGESPFAAASPRAVLQRVMDEPASSLHARRADVASFLDGAVRRALAKRPEDRFPSAAAFSAALTVPAEVPLGGEEASAQEPGAPQDEPAGGTKPGGRLVSARWALYTALTLLVVGLAGGWMLARSSLLGGLASHVAPELSPVTTDRGTSLARGELTLTVVDRAGRSLRTIPARRPWTPRFSPDGRRVAYGAFGEGRGTSDLWVTDLKDGTTRRLTDDDGDSNDPQWSADGTSIIFSMNASGGKDLLQRRVDGGAAHVIAARDGTQFASDWLRNGRALLVTEDAGNNRRDIIVQPADGSPASPYVATSADETAARVSPDGRWVAYTSDASGRAEVYLDSYPKPKHRVLVSSGGGVHPVWRGDGRELYYWSDGTLVAVRMGWSLGFSPPSVGAKQVLFRAPYDVGPNTMYDVSSDGERFVIVQNR
ncbi:MAG: protein kinase [Gemmatimonadaceae bacterium]